MKSFVVQPFGQRIGVTSDPKAFVAWWNKYSNHQDKLELTEVNNCLGMAAMQETRPKLPNFVIYMGTEAQTTTVFHESLHMAHLVMTYCVTPINLESTETQAYLMEHIAKQVIEKIK